MAAHLHEESPVLAAQRRGTASDAEYLQARAPPPPSLAPPFAPPPPILGLSPLSAKVVWSWADMARGLGPGGQSATREWIVGIVALAPGSRPVPEVPLPKLLANGAILHHVGRIVTLLREGRRREVLPSLRLRASGLGPRSKKFADKADVDYFLRVCRDVGLGDVDLFTASAVCGEGPTREIVRVCRCIRTFSVRLEELRPGVFPKFGAGSRAAAMSTASTGEKASLFSGLGKPGTPGGVVPAGEPASEGSEGGGGMGGALLGAAFLGAAVLVALALGGRSVGKINVRESRHGVPKSPHEGRRMAALRKALNQPVPVVFRGGPTNSSEKPGRFTTVYQRPGEEAPSVVHQRFAMVEDD